MNGSKPLHHQCVRYIKLAKLSLSITVDLTVGGTNLETGEIRTAQVIVLFSGHQVTQLAEASLAPAA